MSREMIRDIGQASQPPSSVFCNVCDNLMIPKEQDRKKVLLNYCRNCGYYEVATNPMVFLHILEHHRDTLQYLNTDLAKDPTLAVSHLHPCPKCQHRHVSYHEPETFNKEHEMSLYFICQVCRHKWSYSPRDD